MHAVHAHSGFQSLSLSSAFSLSVLSEHVHLRPTVILRVDAHSVNGSRKRSTSYCDTKSSYFITSYQTEKVHIIGDFENNSVGQYYTWERRLNVTRSLRKDQSKLHQFCIKVLPGIFVGYALCAGGIWRGDIFVVDVEELKNLDASEKCA